MDGEAPKWDVFISYASEDRDLAAPLAEMLTALGVRVWFDRMELRMGDSLRQRVDDGLAQSRYGVVIFSPYFFSKHYPQRELNGLAQLEIDGKKVLLPIWKGISVQEIRKYSPPLADRIALLYEDGLPGIVSEIVNIVRPDIIEELKKKASAYITMRPIISGKELIGLIRSAKTFSTGHDDLNDEQEVKSVGGFIEYVTDLGNTLDFYEAEGEARLGLEITEQIKQLGAIGWKVYVSQGYKYFKINDSIVKIEELAIAVVRSDVNGVIAHKGSFIVDRINSTEKK